MEARLEAIQKFAEGPGMGLGDLSSEAVLDLGGVGPAGRGVLAIISSHRIPAARQARKADIPLSAHSSH